MYDAIIILILVMSFLLGLKRGFVKTAYSMLSLTFSSFLIYFLYDGFSEYFASSEGGKIVSEYVTKNYDGIFAEQFASVVVSAVALVLLYFVVKFLLKLLIGVLDLVSKLPLISTLNKFLGGAIGIVFGALLVIIITNVAYVFPSVSSYIEASEIVKATKILFVVIK